MRCAMTGQWALLGLAAASVLGCSKDPPAAAEAGASATASAAAPSASVAALPSASASAAPEVQHDCPPGSVGLGSFSKPCEAKGNVRMLEVAWNGKYDPNGAPSFKVASKSTKAILYGRIDFYFYDGTGKQIDVKESVEGSDKTHAFHVCSGSLFAGALNPGEKARYDNFSCMKKADLPIGVATIEAEAVIVGFADASGKKNDFYWKNADLAPEARPKGGIK
jgi:hypothetical protein